MPSARQRRAAAAPMLPAPMTSNVFPPIGVEYNDSQCARRWLPMMAGRRLWSISTAMSPYSPALSACAPRLLTTVTPSGTQSMGHRCSTPAPMMWMRRRFGATSARSAVGRSQVTSTSAVRIERSKLSRSQSMNTSRCRATCGYRAAAVSKRSRVMVNTASPSGVGGNVSGEAWLFLMWTRMSGRGFTAQMARSKPP